MFSTIPRTSACTRSTLHNLFRSPLVSHRWHALPIASQLSTKRASNLSQRAFTISHCRHNVVQKPVGTSAPTDSESTSVAGEPTYQDDPKMAIAFTCTVPDCNHRQAHIFSKRSYERGIVIITCSSCKNRDLIADHLGWFENLTGERSHLTIEQMAKAQGEKVTRGTVGENGVFEFAEETPTSDQSSKS